MNLDTYKGIKRFAEDRCDWRACTWRACQPSEAKKRYLMITSYQYWRHRL